MAKKAQASKKKSSKQNKLQNLVYKIKSSRRASVSVVLVLVLAFSGIGYYLTNRSSAATPYNTRDKCESALGVWKDLTGNGVDHAPCWISSNAYIVNYGSGKVGDGIDALNYGSSEHMKDPNYMIVVSGSWRVCDDVIGPDNICSRIKTKGAYNLCDIMKEAIDGYDVKFCTKNDVFIQRM